MIGAALAGDKNGGTTCAACGIIASWLDQYASAKDKTGEQAIRDMCAFLPTELDSVCELAVRLFAEPVQEVLDNDDMTSDTMCHCLEFCFITEGYDQVCHIHPLPDYALADPNGTLLGFKLKNLNLNCFSKMSCLDTQFDSSPICSSRSQSRVDQTD